MKQLTLKFLCVLLAALLILNSKTHAQDLFESKQFSIKMWKPQNWIEASSSDLQNNLDKVKFTDDELQKVLTTRVNILFQQIVIQSSVLEENKKDNLLEDCLFEVMSSWLPPLLTK